MTLEAVELFLGYTKLMLSKIDFGIYVGRMYLSTHYLLTKSRRECELPTKAVPPLEVSSSASNQTFNVFVFIRESRTITEQCSLLCPNVAQNRTGLLATEKHCTSFLFLEILVLKENTS